MGKMKELITGIETVGEYNNTHAGKAWAVSYVLEGDHPVCLDCAHYTAIESARVVFSSDDDGGPLDGCADCAGPVRPVQAQQCPECDEKGTTLAWAGEHGWAEFCDSHGAEIGAKIVGNLMTKMRR